MIFGNSLKATDIVQAVQSKLLPLSPVEAVLERIVTILPRTLIEVELVPENDIEVIDPDRTVYESMGDAPIFLAKIKSQKLKPGWHYLESALTRHNGDRVAKLYLDCGSSYIESKSIFVPSNLRGSIREVIYIPRGVKTLRWGPMESLGIFNQSALILHRISGLESIFRRGWRVLSDILRLRKLAPQSRGGLTYIGAIKDLADAYQRSAKLRLSRYAASGDYAEWIRRFDTVNDAQRTRIVNRIDKMVRYPVISIVMPCYNPNLEWLKEAIESVRSQLYPYWELCISDDASENIAVRGFLEYYKAKDNRIKVVYRENRGHISMASNSAFEIATGEYVALLDQDDALSELALYWVANCILENPDVGLIYSDEDKIDYSGQRISPNFKCDFNYDLFLCQNMISHLGVYRAKLFRELDGFRKGFEGAQDWDLALRCIEQLDPNEIVHIPRVLYHWRMHENSTSASGVLAKPYANTSAERLLADYFSRNNIAARPEFRPDIGMFRIRYSLPEVTPMVTLIVPTRNCFRTLRQCIKSIFDKTDYKNFEILIIDNGSDDKSTICYLEELRNVYGNVRVVIDNGPFNYSAINNRAVSLARGEFVGLINNDVEVISGDWLSEMVGLAMQPGVGAVGAKLLYPNNTLQHAGVVLGIGGVAGHSHKYFSSESHGYFCRLSLTQTCSAVTAACLLVRKSVFEESGGLDQENLAVAYNDVDFCLRLRELGYRNIWTPHAMLYHHESLSRGQEDSPEKHQRLLREKEYMIKRWGKALISDPSYSPNLTLISEDFSYSWPPRVAAV